MAGDWIKVEHVTPDKPEAVRMARLLTMDQDMVVGKLLRLWVWADQNTIEGETLGVTDAFIDRLCHCAGFAAALRARRWLYGTLALWITLAIAGIFWQLTSDGTAGFNVPNATPMT